LATAAASELGDRCDVQAPIFGEHCRARGSELAADLFDDRDLLGAGVLHEMHLLVRRVNDPLGPKAPDVCGRG
jgi:hypothetical protein